MPEEVSAVLVGAVFAVAMLFYIAYRVATGKSAIERDKSPEWKNITDIPL